MKVPLLMLHLNEKTERIIQQTQFLPSTTGPTLRKRNSNWSLGVNIFPTPDMFDATFNVLENEIHTVLEKFENNSEIIQLDINSGIIYDQTEPTIEILQGKYFEIYLYQEESFCIIRLIHERDSRNKEWLSLDADYQENSPWFTEDKIPVS